MKNSIKSTILALLLASGSSLLAQPILEDTYWGAQPTIVTAKDVLGSVETFDLTGVQTSVDNGNVTINIYGNYFDNILSGNDLFNTQLGDLFISVDGLVDNDTYADTLTDYFGSSVDKPIDYTTWEFAVKLGTYTNAGGVLDNEAWQSAGIYAITENDIELTKTFAPYTQFRQNQEWKIKDDIQSQSLGDARWYIGELDNPDPSLGANINYLSITIFGFADIIGNPGGSAIHWTMSCGNDVIETPIVPEPSTIGLLGGAGLLGLLYIRRRVRKA